MGRSPLGAVVDENAAGHAQLERILAAEGVGVERFDLPHDRGPGHVLHLLKRGLLVADDLAVVYEPLAPAPLLEALDERGVRRVACPPEEYETLGANVLAVAPGVCVAAEGNRTRGRRCSAPAARSSTGPSSSAAATAARPA